jgi:hypothetical protein
MRLLLVIWLSVGLAPGFGEVVESSVHVATAGHLAHTEAAHGDFSDPGSEHGCGTTEHLCGCCTSQVVAAGPAVWAIGPTTTTPELAHPGAQVASLDEPAPPYRPPIAS